MIPWATVLLLSCATTQTHLDSETAQQELLLGSDYFAKGLVGPALVELLKAEKANPQSPEIQNMLGLVFLSKAAESEELSTRAQCLLHEDKRLEQEEMDAQYRHAEACFRKAIELKPTYSEALNSLAVVANHFGRYDEAVALELKALSNITYRDPYFAQGNLGWAYLNKRDYARAAKVLRQALFEQPQFCVGRYRLAKVYYSQGEFDHAAEELQLVIDDKKCPIQEAYQLAGLVALKRHERSSAAQLFQRCLTLAPKSCVARECTLAASP